MVGTNLKKYFPLSFWSIPWTTIEDRNVTPRTPTNKVVNLFNSFHLICSPSDGKLVGIIHTDGRKNVNAMGNRTDILLKFIFVNHPSIHNFHTIRRSMSTTSLQLKIMEHCAAGSSLLGIIMHIRRAEIWTKDALVTTVTGLIFNSLRKSTLHDIAPISITIFCWPQSFKHTRWTTSSWGRASLKETKSSA